MALLNLFADKKYAGPTRQLLLWRAICVASSSYVDRLDMMWAPAVKIRGSGAGAVTNERMSLAFPVLGHLALFTMITKTAEGSAWLSRTVTSLPIYSKCSVFFKTSDDGDSPEGRRYPLRS